MGGSLRSGELGPGGRSAEMVSDGSTDADRKVLIKSIGENLLPSTQSWLLWRPGPPVAAPCTRNGHINLLGTSVQVRP
jgi:hypothetical protein